ncbi:MAG: PAS domain-containing protein [Desulfuromonadaceae bacterium]|nr:PAS domain-containing protein [Desulfuromonadaceae bacterium]MDD5106446.1 PAS domain-containing protein [Desulfuromonadaceae bacterium]
MLSHTATLPTKNVPIVRFRIATICAWTLFAIITAIWECNDNMEFKAFTAQSIARANSGVNVTILMTELEHAMSHSNVTHVAIITIIWLMGLVGVWFGFRRISSATDALIAERDNLSSVFDATPMPMLLFGDRMEVVRANSAFRGYCIDYDALPDKRCGTLLKCVNSFVDTGCGNSPACDPCRLMRALRGVSRSGAPDHGETTVLRAERDGGMTEISLLYGVESVLLDGQSHVLMSFMDISERHRMEKKLAASEQEFRSLAETLPDNIARYDRDCRVLYINPVLEKTLGMPLELVIGKVPTEIPSTVPFDEYETRLRSVLASGIDNEMDLLRSDGEGGILYSHIQMVAERDNEGNIIGALAIGHNITELKRLEKQQAAHEQEFRALVDNNPDAIVRYDQFCRRIYVNPAMEQLSSQSADRLIGKAPAEVSVFTPEVNQEIQDTVNRVFERCVSQELELTWKDSGGMIHHVLTRYVPELGANREVTSVLSIARDITAFRNMEAQLQHAQKIESIGLLAGGVAHDFNNILSVIGGYAELLKLTITENEEIISYAREISDFVNRGAELTRSLLAFSGKHELQKQYDSLNQIVTNLQKSMSRLLSSDITLSFELCDDQLPVFADRSQIEQILINLIVNARDALSPGGRICVDTALVEVREDVVESGATLTPGSYGRITVSDNGVGMDTETIARIFDPFFTTKGAGKGTGLGLAIVFGIVGNHGGHISVESSPGNGAAFRVYLPVYHGNKRPKQLQEPQSAELLGNETVLLADDEPNLQQMTAKILRQYGYTVLTATDGEEALQVFEAHKEDIQAVIIDMIMPRMNGRETIARLRYQKPDLPIILTSGYCDVVVDESDMCFLPKPVHFKKLMVTLRALLGREAYGSVSEYCADEDNPHHPDLFQGHPVLVCEDEDVEADDWL